METAFVGGGCFWCIETMMMRLEGNLLDFISKLSKLGIEKTTSGFSGGETLNPTYKEV